LPIALPLNKNNARMLLQDGNSNNVR
jgi:hypothetical protein